MYDVNSCSSYRSELEGIYRTLKNVEYLGMTPEEVEHWCDNKTGVINSETRSTTPSTMIAPDADLVLAIHHLQSTIKYTVKCHHIYGHQRQRQRENKDILSGRTGEATGDGNNRTGNII